MFRWTVLLALISHSTTPNQYLAYWNHRLWLCCLYLLLCYLLSCPLVSCDYLLCYLGCDIHCPGGSSCHFWSLWSTISVLHGLLLINCLPCLLVYIKTPLLLWWPRNMLYPVMAYSTSVFRVDRLMFLGRDSVTAIMSGFSSFIRCFSRSLFPSKESAFVYKHLIPFRLMLSLLEFSSVLWSGSVSVASSSDSSTSSWWSCAWSGVEFRITLSSDSRLDPELLLSSSELPSSVSKSPSSGCNVNESIYSLSLLSISVSSTIDIGWSVLVVCFCTCCALNSGAVIFSGVCNCTMGDNKNLFNLSTDANVKFLLALETVEVCLGFGPTKGLSRFGIVPSSEFIVRSTCCSFCPLFPPPPLSRKLYINIQLLIMQLCHMCDYYTCIWLYMLYCKSDRICSDFHKLTFLHIPISWG